jgi:hypothetical protein
VEEIAQIFEDHDPFLRAVYTFYAYLNGQRVMQMEGWITMCEHCCLLGPKVGPPHAPPLMRVCHAL